MIAGELRETIDAIIGGMRSAQMREVARCRIFQELDNGGIGGQLNRTKKNVESAIERCRRTLSRELRWSWSA